MSAMLCNRSPCLSSTALIVGPSPWSRTQENRFDHWNCNLTTCSPQKLGDKKQDPNRSMRENSCSQVITRPQRRSNQLCERSTTACLSLSIGWWPRCKHQMICLSSVKRTMCMSTEQFEVVYYLTIWNPNDVLWELGKFSMIIIMIKRWNMMANV